MSPKEDIEMQPCTITGPTSPGSNQTNIIEIPISPDSGQINIVEPTSSSPNPVINNVTQITQIIKNALRNNINQSYKLDISKLSEVGKHHIFDVDKLMKDNKNRIYCVGGIGAVVGAITPVVAGTALAVSTGGSAIGPSLYVSITGGASVAGAIVGGITGTSAASTYGSNQKNYFDLRIKSTNKINISLDSLFVFLNHDQVEIYDKENICNQLIDLKIEEKLTKASSNERKQYQIPALNDVVQGASSSLRQRQKPLQVQKSLQTQPRYGEK